MSADDTLRALAQELAPEADLVYSTGEGALGLAIGAIALDAIEGVYADCGDTDAYVLSANVATRLAARLAPVLLATSPDPVLVDVSYPPVDERVVLRLARALYTPGYEDDVDCDLWDDHEHVFECLDPTHQAHAVGVTRSALIEACGTTPASTLPAVAGACPMGCGPTLILSGTGQVMCDAPRCPCPDAVAEILADTQTEHVVDLGQRAFTIRHPLRERLDDALLACTLHFHLTGLDAPPAPVGTYQVAAGARGWADATWSALTDPTPEA